MSNLPMNALLFDMDGTLLDSSTVTNRVWSNWAAERELDAKMVLGLLHGRRAIDVLLTLGLEAEDAEREASILNTREERDMEGVVALPGAASLLGSLPTDKWAIVTSSTRKLAQRRLTAAGLTIPDVLVTCEEVTAGKPAPDGYLLAAERLGVDVQRCLVLEDSTAGIAAGKSAGATVWGIRTSIDVSHTLADFRGIGITVACNGLALDLSGAGYRRDQKKCPPLVLPQGPLSISF